MVLLTYFKRGVLMANSIFGINAKKDVTPLLLGGLQGLEPRSGDSKIGIATVVNGRIFSQQVSGKVSNLHRLLSPKQPESHFGIAYQCQTTLEDTIHQPQLHVSSEIAVAYTGNIVNTDASREELYALGYRFQTERESEVILHYLHRYLDINVGISPVEAMGLVLSRLEGYFSIIALFAQPEISMMAARRGCSLAVGVAQETLYIGFDTTALKLLAYPVMQLEEGNAVVLRLV
ncbi:MAG: hypothetical protein DRR16_29435 [Candidatus Parabeggiatoa sp. nov. 3]|nr:MAG: hypothetical protein DRR00_27715 [Gammaproteobacteria bacterium]RKZ66290.1 MAG: hypothetical protein DRQ99_10100 [Gammaproteobacteria bacterium]RKZ77550.1 MAG: hypothetical protein DRR16_29435 [Gammaproteobacteria bacterium]